MNFESKVDYKKKFGFDRLLFKLLEVSHEILKTNTNSINTGYKKAKSIKFGAKTMRRIVKTDKNY